jgi:hypothetical protein
MAMLGFTQEPHTLSSIHTATIFHDIEACLLSCMFCVCLRLVVKSSDSGLPKSCTAFQTQIPFTPANSIGEHLAVKNTAHVSQYYARGAEGCCRKVVQDYGNPPSEVFWSEVFENCT